MATEWKKTPDEKLQNDFWEKLNKTVDTNKDKMLTDEEIENFVKDEKNAKKVKQLWEYMKNHFETHSEVLDQFKESIWKICERILEGDIDLNKGKILYFYLKHFHKEDGWVGRDIIQVVVDWSKWDWYQKVLDDVAGVGKQKWKSKRQRKNNGGDEESQETESQDHQTDDWFESLPWAKEIIADWKRKQDLEKCKWILSIDLNTRINQEDFQWLEEYKQTIASDSKILEMDAEIANNVELRVNLEKCYQLIETEDLTVEDVKWLWEYKDNWSVGPELQTTIKEKIDAENLKICNRLLGLPELSSEDIQWLEEYKNTEGLDPEIVNKITVKFSEEILRDNIPLTTENAQVLQECVDKGIWDVEKIKWRQKVEDEENRITKALAEDMDNPLKSLEILGVSKESQLTKENRTNLIADIKTPEDVSKITKDNIAKYLPAAKNVSSENLSYVVYNFQQIIGRHLCYHQWYKLWYGQNPDLLATGYWKLESIVKENDMLESALRWLQELWATETKLVGKWRNKRKVEVPKKTLDQKIDYVLGQNNNHILFDLWLKTELSSYTGKDAQKKTWDTIYKIFSNPKYKAKIQSFAKINTYIKTTLANYNDAVRKVEEENRRIEAENAKIRAEKAKYDEVQWYLKWAKVAVPKNIQYMFPYYDKYVCYASTLTILSRNALLGYENVYNRMKKERNTSESYELFCSVYESSKEFYEGNWKEKWTPEQLWLPGNLMPEDYLWFLSATKSMNDNIDAIKRAAERAKKKVDNSGSWYTYTNSLWFVGNTNSDNKDRIDRNKNYEIDWVLLDTTRKYVELWKKSWVPIKNRPKEFMWTTLDWNYSTTDSIIRNTFWEWVVDKVKSFWRNATWWCWQQAFWDVCWLALWIAASAGTLLLTKDTGMAWVAFYVWNKVGNGFWQMVWDWLVDGLGWKVFWLWGESWANRYDGLETSARLWVWLYERDDNGIPVRAMSDREFFVKTVFEIGAAYFTGKAAWNYGITVASNPFKYTAIDEFISKPLIARIPAAATNAAISAYEIWNGQWAWAAANQAMHDQFLEEYWPEWLTKKISTVILATLMVKWYNKVCERSKSKSTVVSRMSEKLDKFDKYLKDNAVDLKNLDDKAVRNLWNKGFTWVFNELVDATNEGFSKVVAPLLPLISAGVMSEAIPPQEGLRMKRAYAEWKLAEAKRTGNASDITTYEQLLARYDDLKTYMKDKLGIWADNPISGFGIWNPGWVTVSEHVTPEEWTSGDQTPDAADQDSGSAYGLWNNVWIPVSENFEKLLNDVRMNVEIEISEDEISAKDLLEWLPEWIVAEFKDGEWIDKTKSEQEVTVVLKFWEEKKEVDLKVKIEWGKIKVDMQGWEESDKVEDALLWAENLEEWAEIPDQRAIWTNWWESDNVEWVENLDVMLDNTYDNVWTGSGYYNWVGGSDYSEDK